MKNLICLATLTLALASFSSTAYGNTETNNEHIPYITGSSAFPIRYRPSIATRVRHSFRLQIPTESSALSHLTIGIPHALKMRKNITISDNSGRKIPALISANDSKALIIFISPVPPGAKLNIDMNNVTVTGFSNAYLYPISAKMVGMNADIPVGIVRFGIY